MYSKFSAKSGRLSRYFVPEHFPQSFYPSALILNFQENFYKVDHDYILNIARIAKESGCEQFHLVTSSGANKNSLLYGLKVKGITEEDVTNLNFRRLSIYRPGIVA